VRPALSVESSNEVIEWFERALSLAPSSAEAQAFMAVALSGRVMNVLPSSWTPIPTARKDWRGKP
jgi:hypothetical protein